LDDRRTILKDAIASLVIRPGRQGQRVFTEDRVEWHWAEEADAGDDYADE
jgi:hypothetical protein